MYSTCMHVLYAIKDGKGSWTSPKCGPFPPYWTNPKWPLSPWNSFARSSWSPCWWTYPAWKWLVGIWWFWSKCFWVLGRWVVIKNHPNTSGKILYYNSNDFSRGSWSSPTSSKIAASSSRDLPPLAHSSWISSPTRHLPVGFFSHNRRNRAAWASLV